MKPVDLRGILKYVPRFRDHIFVIALDSGIIAHENLHNVLTDIAVLNSLRIKVVLVHGIATQMEQLAGRQKCSDLYGEGITDAATLEVAIKASSQASYLLMKGLTRAGLQYAHTNALRGVEIGILRGKDYLFSGKIEKMATSSILKLLDDGVLPLFSPILFDRDGQALRANSDALASEIARQLGVSKLIYITMSPGLCLRGKKVDTLTLEELAHTLRTRPKALDERTRSKARCTVSLLSSGSTPRAHILDGRLLGGLLTEIFDSVGTGTMIHTNDYQQIRPARKKDIPAIYAMTRKAVRNETLRGRTRRDLEKMIGTFYVYEIDGSIIAFVSLTTYPRSKTVELAALYVQPFHQGRNIGSKMVAFACDEARQRGFHKIVTATTQSFSFFNTTCEFTEGTLKDLPSARRTSYKKEARNSRILVKKLKP